MVEEIQSDWHQAGRKKGYREANYDKEREALLDNLNDLTRKKSSLAITTNQNKAKSPST